jgi:hypothetical protein
MAKNPPDEMSSSEPSDLALKHEREIGKLNEGLESVDSRLGGVERKVDTGFERVFTLLDGFRDRLAPKNNSALYLGVAGLMLAGIPLVAGLVYFTITVTTVPIGERLSRVERAVQTNSDNMRDDFELLIRVDQCLIDRGLKSNETDTALTAARKTKNKEKKQK